MNPIGQATKHVLAAQFYLSISLVGFTRVISFHLLLASIVPWVINYIMSLSTLSFLSAQPFRAFDQMMVGTLFQETAASMRVFMWHRDQRLPSSMGFGTVLMSLAG